MNDVDNFSDLHYIQIADLDKTDRLRLGKILILYHLKKMQHNITVESHIHTMTFKITQRFCTWFSLEKNECKLIVIVFQPK